VLVADDSPYNLFVMEELIKFIDTNIEVSLSYNGEEAIQKVKSNL
jgi:hypothetical protein